jgi:2-polyprenyl-3-methyl-5-hydroxy-6-metoxy-1,4-benzoquinol methylase
MVCLTCDKPGLGEYLVVREMMFGTRGEFSYRQCDNCNSIQIAEIPTANELATHYPENYYSFCRGETSLMKAVMSTYRNRHALGDENWIGRVLNKYKPAPSVFPILKSIGVRKGQAILDVGCGSAATLLHSLAASGFVNLLGADPFIERDIETQKGARVLKRHMHEIVGRFDLIMFNHSLEHVDDPRAVLTAARARLKPSGRCLVRIPTVSSMAFETYGADWVQLDAPRHLFVPSREGMKALAESCGFVVEQVIDDSIGFQFSASELYRKDIPLNAQKLEQYFSKATLKEFRRIADDANASHRGDQAAFILEATL